MLFKTTLLATGVLFVLGTPAFAWNNTTNGNGPQQIVDGGPGSQAVAHQHQMQRQRQNQHQTATGGAGGEGGRGGNSRVNVTNNVTDGSGGGSYGGGGNNYNGGIALAVPDLAGQASCSGSISLGGLGSMAGGSGGGMWEFHDCKVIREAKTLFALGYRDRAVSELCQQIDRIKEAFGGKCPTEQTVTTQNATANVPDYCFTRNAGDKNQHYECDHAPVTTEISGH